MLGGPPDNPPPDTDPVDERVALLMVVFLAIGIPVPADPEAPLAAVPPNVVTTITAVAVVVLEVKVENVPFRLESKAETLLADCFSGPPTGIGTRGVIPALFVVVAVVLVMSPVEAAAEAPPESENWPE